MVKVYLKGGVWKNSEDEILKAAVQKYGKQQWGRVASLLNKKTAKQAKARWHEWLDPSIRKTEWSRAEEEKLLHLAKLLPAQWKTIGPLVGRTATQCQEHYEYLLDQAAGGDAADDLRKQALKPGQIDAHPESKPARPDPIDMDEDEMEMLQEARARLANTQGKKAKRKAREKMLAQAKRLAELQKRRELKQAGLLSKTASKKSKKDKKQIDLGVEIPFHKPAPVGFHDTSGEATRTKSILDKRIKSVDYQQVNESQYRSRDREAAARKKRDESRLKILEQSNEKFKKPKEEEAPARPRGSLNLPEPSVTDKDLEQIAKMHQSQREMLEGDGPQATQALLADYSDKPLPTPMRTPATASAKPNLMHEASQLRALERGQTPLLISHEEPVDMEVDEPANSTAYSSQHLDRDGAGRTPGAASHMDDTASVGASTFASSKYSIRELARQERKAAKIARQKLEEALAALPAPQFEYELAAPEQVDEEDMQVETVEEEVDQADIEAAVREKKRRELEKVLEARSTVVKRKDLPRPQAIVAFDKNMTGATEAEQLILQEMKLLLQRDAVHHSVTGTRDVDGRKRKRDDSQDQSNMVAPEVELLPEDLLKAADALIQEEMGQFSREPLAESAFQAAESVVYTGKGWSTKESDKVASLRLEFETLQEALSVLRKKNDKAESKQGIVTGGYAKRARTLNGEVLQSFAEARNASIEEAVYSDLYEHEYRGALSRSDSLKRDIAELKKVEATLQREYGDLVIRRRRQQVKATTT